VARPVVFRRSSRRGNSDPVEELSHPPLVRRYDSHVIRTDVDERSHVVRVEFNEERLKLLRGAEVRIQFWGIDDVVAVVLPGTASSMW